ncbi:MAG: SAF domain-containing protein [Sulfuricurvum sp.]|nr:SAF domain-containing protein [Sulfuricurvum sp.]
MNNKRTVVLSIGLLSLAIFAIIVMVMMYVKNEDATPSSENNVAAYVAAKEIRLGQKITQSDVELRSLPRDYIGQEPLSIADIVDHYARVGITKNDLIRPEKLTLQFQAQQEPTAEENVSAMDTSVSGNVMQHDAISLPLNVFKNLDTTLRKDEYIDIVGISEYGEEKHQFATRYIGVHVLVGGFMKEGKKINEMVSVTVDEKTQATSKVVADDIILNMSPQDISRFLSLYYRSQELNNDHSHNADNLYRGHIWMVKSKPIVSANENLIKFKMMNVNTVPRHKAKPQLSQNLPPLPKLISASRGIVTYEQ